MNRSLAAVFALVAMAFPALSEDSKVDAALKTFEQVASDPAKFKIYCAMNKLMDQTGDDDKKAEAAEPQIDAYIKELGPEFEAAWAVGEALDETSPEAKRLDDALTVLDSRCPK